MPETDDVLADQIDYYRARADEYDQWWRREGRYDRGEANARWHDQAAEVEAALDAASPTGDVLEIACGTGWWTQRLARHADRLTVVDAAPEALALCRQRCGPGVDYVQADLFAWRPERVYDFVFFSFWLSHVPDQRFDAFWDAVRGALRPGGRAFVVDSLPAPESRAKDHAVADPEAWTQRRRLNDGREFEIVKVYHDPDRLTDRLDALGWRADLQRTDDFFFYGPIRPA
ncbi:MAG: class I SAM-dependent methyltransferase [Planctomycetota bacterium]